MSSGIENSDTFHTKAKSSNTKVKLTWSLLQFPWGGPSWWGHWPATFCVGFSHPSEVPLPSFAEPAAGCTPPGRVEGLVWGVTVVSVQGVEGRKNRERTRGYRTTWLLSFELLALFTQGKNAIWDVEKLIQYISPLASLISWIFIMKFVTALGRCYGKLTLVSTICAKEKQCWFKVRV